MKCDGKIKCPVCGSRVVTRYDAHYECDECGRQWTHVETKKPGKK